MTPGLTGGAPALARLDPISSALLARVHAIGAGLLALLTPFRRPGSRPTGSPRAPLQSRASPGRTGCPAHGMGAREATAGMPHAPEAAAAVMTATVVTATHGHMATSTVVTTAPPVVTAAAEVTAAAPEMTTPSHVTTAAAMPATVEVAPTVEPAGADLPRKPERAHHQCDERQRGQCAPRKVAADLLNNRSHHFAPLDFAPLGLAPVLPAPGPTSRNAMREAVSGTSGWNTISASSVVKSHSESSAVN